jgi:hypothetical protein
VCGKSDLLTVERLVVAPILELFLDQAAHQDRACLRDRQIAPIEQCVQVRARKPSGRHLCRIVCDAGG